MKRTAQSRPPAQRAWRVFAARNGREIDIQVRLGRPPCCPCCRTPLEAQYSSRLTAEIPLGASAYDLDCRVCRRFWSMIQHTDRSLRLVRMRRFVAALRAVEVQPASSPEVMALA